MFTSIKKIVVSILVIAFFTADVPRLYPYHPEQVRSTLAPKDFFDEKDKDAPTEAKIKYLGSRLEKYLKEHDAKLVSMESWGKQLYELVEKNLISYAETRGPDGVLQRIRIDIGGGYKIDYSQGKDGIVSALIKPEAAEPLITPAEKKDIILRTTKAVVTTFVILSAAELIPFPHLLGDVNLFTVSLAMLAAGMGTYFSLYKYQVMSKELQQELILRGLTDQYLKEAEERYKRLLDASGVPICMINDDGTVALVNKQFEKVLGVARTDIEGKFFWDFISKEDLSRVQNCFYLVRTKPDTVAKTVECRVVNAEGLEKKFFWNFDRLEGTRKYVVSGIDLSTIQKLQDALRETQSRLNTFLRSAVDAIVTIDKEGDITDWNPAAERLFGYARDEVVGKSVHRILASPEDFRKAMRGLRAFAATGEGAVIGRTVQLTAFRKDKTPVNIELSVSPYTERGEQGALAVVRDVSGRKAMEDAVREAERLLRELFNATSESALLISKDGTVLAINEQALRSAGVARESLTGKVIYDIFPPDKAAERRAVVDKVIQSKQRYAYEDEDAGRMYLIHMYPILDSAGNVEKIAQFATDITEIREKEKALKLQNELEKLVSDVSQVFAYFGDLNNNIKYFIEILGKYSGAGRADFFSIDAGKGTVSGVTAWFEDGPGTQQEFGEMPLDRFPYAIEQLQKFQPLVIPSVERYPDEFMLNKELLVKAGIVSQMVFPVYAGQKVIGMIVLSSIGEEKAWGHESATLGKTGADIISGACERFEIHQTLMKSEDTQRSLLNAMKDMAILLGKTGDIIAANQAAVGFMGMSEDALKGSNAAKLFPGEEGRKRRAKTLEAMRTKQPVEFEDLIKGRDVFISINPVLDAAGAVDLVAVYVRDITSVKKAQAQIREQAVFLQQLIDAVPNHVFVKDTEGRYTFCNAHFLGYFGSSQEAYLGKTVYDFHTDRKLADKYHEMDMELISRPGTPQDPANQIYESEIVDKDGRRVTHIFYKAPLFDSAGNVTGIVGVAVDISRRKEMEKEIIDARGRAEEASRAKSEFLANMSHEIRTPMNHIMGFAQLLLAKKDVDSEQREYGETIYSATRNLLQILNDILDFSKIEAGKLELAPEETDVRKFLRETVKIFEPEAQRKGLQLKFAVDKAVPRTILADPVRLRQVIQNLIGNALKFTAAGEIAVTVEKEMSAGNQAVLRFSVRDTGIGIPKERQSRIFEAFTQVDATTTRKYGGTGLGLTLALRLVKLMGGGISVESQPGEGSTFGFTGLFDIVTERTPGGVVLDSAFGSLSVLAADDDPTNRKLVEIMLNALGVSKMKIIGSGDEALALIRESPDGYDVIFLDFNMPGRSGPDAAKEILAAAREKGAAPSIVALTADDRQETKDICRAAGMERFVTKPLDMRALSQVLSEIAEERTARAAAPRRVLVAEDDPNNQKLIGQILKEAGHSVVLVGNGREAVERIASGEEYDMILMDVRMPELDGVAATRLIRESEKRTGRRIPVVGWTAHAMKDKLDQFSDAGMEEVLTKPADSGQIIKAIEKYALKGSGAVLAKTVEEVVKEKAPAVSAAQDKTAPAPVADAGAPASRGKILIVEDEKLLAMLNKRQFTDQGYEVLEANTPALAAQRVREAQDKNERIEFILMDVSLSADVDGVALAEQLRKDGCRIPIFLNTNYDADSKHFRDAQAEGFIDGVLDKNTAAEEKIAKIAAALPPLPAVQEAVPEPEVSPAVREFRHGLGNLVATAQGISIFLENERDKALSVPELAESHRIIAGCVVSGRELLKDLYSGKVSADSPEIRAYMKTFYSAFSLLEKIGYISRAGVAAGEEGAAVQISEQFAAALGDAGAVREYGRAINNDVYGFLEKWCVLTGTKISDILPPAASPASGAAPHADKMLEHDFRSFIGRMYILTYFLRAFSPREADGRLFAEWKKRHDALYASVYEKISGQADIGPLTGQRAFIISYFALLGELADAGFLRVERSADGALTGIFTEHMYQMLASDPNVKVDRTAFDDTVGRQFVFLNKWNDAARKELLSLEPILLPEKSRHPSILVADDDDMIRDLLGSFFAMEGYDVEFAKSGEEALEHARAARQKGMPYDAIVSDNDMKSKLTGAGLSKELRKEGFDTPFFLHTGDNLKDKKFDGLKEDNFVTEFIKKPSNPDGIVKLVKDAIAARADAKRILIADDDDVIRETLKSYFERKGYRVFAAKNGEEALRLAQEARAQGMAIEFMVTDMDMSPSTRDAGAVLSKKLREEGFAFPIFVNTGEADYAKTYKYLVDEGIVSALMSKTTGLPQKMEIIKSVLAAIEEQRRFGTVKAGERINAIQKSDTEAYDPAA